MSAGSPVLYAASEQVATITLNRPAQANAVDLDVARSLEQAILRALGDPAADVLLLAGAGARFCGGGDLSAMAAAPDRPAFIRELADTAHRAVLALDRADKPVLAAVQGAAAGIGLSLLLSADLVIAETSARFVTAYTSVGLTPDGGMSWLLPRAVGQRRATELILTAAPLGAEAAQALGIVSTVCPDGESLTHARAAAAALTARPGHALSSARRLIRESWSRPLAEHLDAEAAAISAAAGTPETEALIRRFLGG
ncbi:enoyl-CoA hydratase/isomerase family protein [Conexibacter sp. DBS9H8]|uniref:enoyl-CoA hydratase/isomerase family protein n=1 Tax=Conexibacter sp. DBS9H8 TaxID=2937801 RepID=UPI00200F4564|nr:enoyl-CoA hydratase-related protein [Conexibacter sp. DBS9H8]